MKNIFYFLTIIIVSISCGKFGGDRSLGNNIKVVEGSSEEDRAIIYCPDENKPCSEGITLIQHVDEVKSNHDWTLVRTIDKDKKESYWIINMDFAAGDKDCKTADCGDYVKNFLFGPLTLEDFNGAREEFDITLDLPKKQ